MLEGAIKPSALSNSAQCSVLCRSWFVEALKRHISDCLVLEWLNLFFKAGFYCNMFLFFVFFFRFQKAFRTGTSTRLDDRVFAMCQLKYQPLAYLMLMIHPALYRVDDLSDEVRLFVSNLRLFSPVYQITGPPHQKLESTVHVGLHNSTWGQ